MRSENKQKEEERLAVQLKQAEEQGQKKAAGTEPNSTGWTTQPLTFSYQTTEHYSQQNPGHPAPQLVAREVTKTVTLYPSSTPQLTKLDPKKVREHAFKEEQCGFYTKHAIGIMMLSAGTLGLLALQGVPDFLGLPLSMDIALFGLGMAVEYSALQYNSYNIRSENHRQYADSLDLKGIEATIDLFKTWQADPETHQESIANFADAVKNDYESGPFSLVRQQLKNGIFNPQSSDSEAVLAVLQHGNAQKKIDFLLVFTQKETNQGSKLFRCIMEQSEIHRFGKGGFFSHQMFRSHW